MEINYLYELDWKKLENQEKDLGNNYDNLTFELGSRGIYKKNSYKYALDYVGIISYREKLIPILPKFLKGKDLSSEKKFETLKLLVEIFKKYQKESLEDLHSNSGYENLSNNKLTLIDTLLKDYIENGLYENHIETYEINGDGEADWENTIENEQDYMVNGVPIYIDLWTKESINHEGDYIRRLHQYILNICIDYLSNLELEKKLGLIEVPDLNFPIQKDTLGEEEYMVNMIDNQLKLEFGDRDIRLLKLMKSFIKKTFEVSSNNINLWGTRSFYTVWERVCGKVLKNQYENFKDEIPSPMWKALGKKNEYPAKGKHIPDVLRKVGKNFFILDAKYYNFNFNEDGKIEGNAPGIEDVTKQFAYEMYFKKRYGENIYNYFVIPTTEESQVIGEVSLEIFGDLKPIKVLALNYDEVFKMYLEDKSYSTNFFEKIL